MRSHHFVGENWYWVSRRYQSEQAAKEAWEKLERIGRARHGALDLGFYRHGPSGIGSIFVTAVSLTREGVAIAQRVLGGEEAQWDPETIEALAARRVRAMADLIEQEAPPGAYAMRRGSRGAKLHRDGTMDEQIGEG